jgi:hypothetical protein
MSVLRLDSYLKQEMAYGPMKMFQSKNFALQQFLKNDSLKQNFSVNYLDSEQKTCKFFSFLKEVWHFKT